MSFEQYMQFKKAQSDNKLYDSKTSVNDMFLYMKNQTNTTTQKIFENLLNAKRLFDEKRNEVYGNELFDTFTTRFVCQFAHNIDILNVFEETDKDNIVELNITQPKHTTHNENEYTRQRIKPFGRCHCRSSG